MKKTLLNLVALGAVSAFAFLGCSSGSSNSANAIATNSNNVAAANANDIGGGTAYPQSVADKFLESCEGAGSKPEFCACVFEKIQQKYTFEEFSVIESKLVAGQPPADFVEFSGKARAACTK